MSRVILDASALIALLNEEKGSELVESHLPQVVMSTVNMAEVSSYLIMRGFDADEIQQLFLDLAIPTIDYTEQHAYLTAALLPKTKAKGLSLGDRACLSLAIIEKLPILTADKIWATLDLGISITLIR